MLLREGIKAKDTLYGVIRFLVREDGSLLAKTFRGGLWIFLLRAVYLMLNFTKLIVLARLLLPRDFGLVGVALILFSTVEAFSQIGFEPALIQKRGAISKYLDTAWTIQVTRGLILSIVMFLSAPLAVVFFNEPQLAVLVRVLGTVFLLRGFTNVGIVYFKKYLKFRSQFIYEISGIFADFIASITIAIIFRNVWALVWGVVMGNLVRTLVSYIIHPYRPKIAFNCRRFTEMVAFGRWISAGNILQFLNNQGDDAFVSKVLGVTSLGYYQLAYRLSTMPVVEGTQIISNIAFPAYSLMQDNIKKLRDSYLVASKLISFVAIPLIGFIIVLTPEIVLLFIGKIWLPIVPLIQIFAIEAFIKAISCPRTQIYRAIGRPDVSTKIGLLRFTVTIVLIYPLTVVFGTIGSAGSVAVGYLVSYLVSSFVLYNILDFRNIYEFFTPVIFPLFSTLLIIIGINIVKSFVEIEVFELFFVLLGFVTVYLGLLYPLDGLLKYNIKSVFQKFRLSIKD